MQAQRSAWDARDAMAPGAIGKTKTPNPRFLTESHTKGGKALNRVLFQKEGKKEEGRATRDEEVTIWTNSTTAACELRR
jgi:hypothetical protein